MAKFGAALETIQRRQDSPVLNKSITMINESSDSNSTDSKSNELTCYVCNRNILDPSIPFIFNLDLFNDTCERTNSKKYEVCEKNQACFVRILKELYLKIIYF